MLTSKITNSHDRITIAIKEGNDKNISVRWNRYSDSMTAKGVDFSQEENNAILARFMQVRTKPSLVGAKLLGEAATAICAIAEKCTTLQEFAGKLAAIK
jgi:hypothetical protein